MKSKLIAIVDEHPLVRHALGKLLQQESDLNVCGEASSLADAIQLVRNHPVDLVITDLRLRDGSGLQLIKEIRQLNQRTKILVSTACDSGVYAERAMKFGAVGFVSKQDEVSELLQAVRKVLSGEVFVSSAINKGILENLKRPHDNQTAADGVSKVARLTDRELRVFELIGTGFSTHEIATQLEVSRKTVESHRERIKSKLNIGSASRLSHRAVEWMILQN